MALWRAHARAWDLGRSSPVMGYDAAQYAVAARTLADQGRLATPYALPVELAKQPRPPWPLAVVQPGMVVFEAALERLAPRTLPLPGRVVDLSTPRQREWLVLVLPFLCYFGLALFAARTVSRLLQLHAPDLGARSTIFACLTVGLSVLLDPEAQHFSTGGFTELPYTFGLLVAIAVVALGLAPRHPLALGLLLGVTGAFRANMLWTVPLFAFAAAWTAEPPRRTRAFLSVLIGFALPLAPWWIYKWRMFGDPGWDLTRYVVWDGVEGRTWFSLFHRPELPQVPAGLNAASLLAAKVARNLPDLLLALGTGPRALGAGALLVWLCVARPARPLAAAGWLVLANGALGVLTTALSIPWLRYAFPSRIPLEIAGLLATGALVARFPGAPLGPAAIRTLRVAFAVLAIGWGILQTGRGLSEARATAAARGLPSDLSLVQIARLVAQEVPRGEPVMSNLGPTLAWYAHRPVIHLALAPQDLDDCREQVDFRHVVLVFRATANAWPEWRELLADPSRAPSHPDWNIRRVREFATGDEFRVVWLEMGAPRPRLAAAPDQRTIMNRRVRLAEPIFARNR
jgi:hypothetical protein